MINYANADITRINSLNVVIDTDSKLMWQDNNDTKSIRMDWYSTVDYCENLSLAGFDDWRLPTIEALGTLDQKKGVFRNIEEKSYWSSSRHLYLFSRRWAVDFSGNKVGYLPWVKDFSWYVRCVRDIQ